MKFINFYQQFARFVVVSLPTIRKFYPNFDRRRLSEWQDKGYLVKLIRGHYLFSSLPINQTVLFYIANQLNPHSYISLETALSFYQFIPEGVTVISSITTTKTASYQTPIAKFKYQSVKPELLIAYQRHDFDLNVQQRAFFKLASKEKAILDYLYLHSELKDLNSLQALRFNPEELEQVDIAKLEHLAKLYQNLAFNKRVANLISLINND